MNAENIGLTKKGAMPRRVPDNRPEFPREDSYTLLLTNIRLSLRRCCISCMSRYGPG